MQSIMNSPIDLGFIGLGAMGFPMASNLIKKSAKGSRIFIYDVFEASMTKFAANFPDATVVCSSPAEVSRSAVSAVPLPRFALVKLMSVIFNRTYSLQCCPRVLM